MQREVPFAARALASGTSATDARDNTATTGTGGVPIYWLGGDKVADDYADFYDNTWDSRVGRTEAGSTSIPQTTLGIQGTRGWVWTGSESNGTKQRNRYAGAGFVGLGVLSSGGRSHMLDSDFIQSPSHQFPLYALSPVLTVVPPRQTGFRARAEDGAAVLTWDNPNFGNSFPRVTYVWEYRQRAGGGAWGEWTAIPGYRCRTGRGCMPFLGPGRSSWCEDSGTVRLTASRSGAIVPGLRSRGPR